MDLNSLLTWACIWLGFDALSDMFCIALCLASVALVKNAFKESH